MLSEEQINEYAREAGTTADATELSGDAVYRFARAIEREARQQALEEIERLRAENTILRQCRIDNRGHIDKLSQECDELRADAERYRWLKSKAVTEERDGGYVRSYVFPHVCYADGSTYKGQKPYYYNSINAAIDAARKEEGK